MFLCMGTALLLFIQWSRNQSSTVKVVSPQTSLNLAATTQATKLVVDLSDRRVYVYRQQTLVASYPVAIGQAGWETPTGSFRIMQMQQNPSWINPITGEVIPAGRRNPLGKRWIGFWSDGRSAIGFHGTAQEASLGQAVSHGCLRMRDQDVEALYQQVALDTVVTVRP